MDSASDEKVEDVRSPSIRRSSRKKVQTAHYGQDSPGISSAPSSSQKEQSEETSEYKEESQNTDSHDSDDSDNVPLSHFSPGKGRKRPAKALRKQPSAKKTKASRLKGGTSFVDSGNRTSMFDIVKGGKASIQAVVDDWIGNYNSDATQAMVDLIQWIIQCCGCKGNVTEEMLEEEENVNAIRKLTEVFDEESHEYPLIMSGPEYKKFKSNFCDFIECLIEQCQHSIVYDSFMMDRLIAWLISLSDSQVRAFRHTSSLAGMKLVTALTKIALKVNVELDNTQRQLDSEKQKSASKRGIQKVEMLQNKKNQLRDNIKDLEEFMSFIFQGIFVHRYRLLGERNNFFTPQTDVVAYNSTDNPQGVHDNPQALNSIQTWLSGLLGPGGGRKCMRDIRPEIRSLCISEIGCWMKDYSSLYLSHKYLKYVVWTLHDKVGDVRLHALQSLTKLYEIEEFLPQLEPLTSRFKGRIVAMTLDKENDVTAEAIKLVTLLFRYGELDEEDCQQVEQLVFCNHRQVSHEAGYFLHERLSAGAESSSPSKIRASKKLEFQKNCEYMKKLIDFFISSQIHNHASYLVDSMWQHCEILKNWKVMTSMLLEDACNEDLTDDEEKALIEIMTCCCRQAATGQGPPGRQIKRLLSTKEKKTIVNDKQEMSAHFMMKLPALLGKYGTDVPKAENLVSIPQYFDLEEYTQRRLGKQFEDLLDQIDDLVQKCPEMPLLEECAKTYRTLTDNELTLRSKAEVALNKLMDNVVELFKGACTILDEDGDRSKEESESDKYALEVNSKRIAAFYKSHDLGSWDLYESLFAIVQKKKNASDEVLLMALVSLEMLLLWSLHSLDSNHPNKRDMKTLERRLGAYIHECSEMLTLTLETSLETQKQAFLSLCDILVVFAKQLMNNHPLLAPVVYQADRQLQNNCREFVNQFVFSNSNEHDENENDDEDNTEIEVEELNEKRVVLAGFCKFIAYGIFDMKLASSLFSRIISEFGNFGDIIKHTMAKCREINKKGYTRTVALTLTQQFEQLQEEGLSIEKTSEEFVALKELAKRLSLTFGVDSSKANVRTSMITLHREAILFSFQRNGDTKLEESFPNLLFLDVINECVFRLIPQDKKVVLKYLQEQASQAKIDLNKTSKSLEPLSSYFRALRDDHQAVGGKTERTPRARPLAPKAKRKLVVDGTAGETGRGEKTSEEDDQTLRKSQEEEEEELEVGEQEEEEEQKEAEAENQDDESKETPPILSRQTKGKKAENSQTSAKRKRDVLEDDNIDEEVEENSEDEFESDKPSSQVSWVSSQPKRSAKLARITYGKSKPTARGRKSAEEAKEEKEEDEEEEVDNEEKSSESPKSSPPRRKRTSKEFPEDIFEGSPAQDTQSDDDLAAAF